MSTQKRNHHSPSARTHIVLVPGFAGFDALGQMEYYAGVTPQFRAWKDASRRSAYRHATLHYFDNLPTAAVETRATRLRDYLAKRIARGEFQPEDSVALVGHSTGGLDIRRMIWDLHNELQNDADAQFMVDGTRDTPYGASARQILDFIDRQVFLSVPQFGTNIADWVRDHRLEANVIIAQLRASVEVSQIPLIDIFQELLADTLTSASNLDLMRALDDALKEAEVRITANHMQTALAQECASELGLYLRHIATDFAAIEDLAAKPNGPGPASPAHFNDDDRDNELAIWNEHHIKPMSFATLGARPFEFPEHQLAPVWAPIDLLSDEPERAPENGQHSDFFYRMCYRACAGGPFDYHRVKDLPNPPALEDEHGMPHTIERWDNDGIVNTASMLWPNGPNTVLVNADHMDIVGHFKRTDAADPESGRRYDSYNLLKSGSGFHCDTFRKVWSEAFDFCVS